MNRTQTACFALLASAFVLSAILIVRLDEKAQPNAVQADQNIYQPSFQMMTARTRGGVANPDESLFVLDNTKGILVVYKPNVANQKLEWLKTLPLDEAFGKTKK